MSEYDTRKGAGAPTVQLPLIDRLIDQEPDKLRDSPISPGESLDALHRSVRRDLEALLNTRRRWRSWPQEFAELSVSPLGYGISDFSSGAFSDPLKREWLRFEIEQTIRRFEPRLVRLVVRLIEPKEELERTLRLRIEGLLRTDPAPEPIAFDTLVDAATAEVRVRASLGSPEQSPDNV